MNRLLTIAALLLVLSLLGKSVSAQGDGPPPGGFEIAPGVMAEALAFVEGREEPVHYRLTFAPGTIYEVLPAPTISLGYLEAGALSMTLDTPVTITRAGTMDEPGEAIAAGDEFTLSTGDYLVLPPMVAGEIRNDGEEPAVVVVADIAPATGGMPGGATPDAGTPAATPAT